jgi:hypothetical protein
MPGLLRGAARVAVVAGTATAVSNRVSRRQANRWAAQDEQQYAQQEPQPVQQVAAEPEPVQDPIALLTQLGQLHTDGVLTDEEFAVQKAKILR